MADEPRIAIVDDDQFVRDAASSRFRSMRFVGQAFASAEEELFDSDARADLVAA